MTFLSKLRFLQVCEIHTKTHILSYQVSNPQINIFRAKIRCLKKITGFAFLKDRSVIFLSFWGVFKKKNVGSGLILGSVGRYANITIFFLGLMQMFSCFFHMLGVQTMTSCLSSVCVGAQILHLHIYSPFIWFKYHRGCRILLPRLLNSSTFIILSLKLVHSLLVNSHHVARLPSISILATSFRLKLSQISFCFLSLRNERTAEQQKNFLSVAGRLLISPWPSRSL